MPRRPPLHALHLVEVSELPMDGVVLRRHGRSFGAELPQALEDVSADAEVYVVPKEERLTPAEAGRLIGMSPSRIKQLLDAKVLPFEPVGRDRRIIARDLFAYRDKRDQRLEAAAGGFVTPSELERPEPDEDDLLEDVE